MARKLRTRLTFILSAAIFGLVQPTIAAQPHHLPPKGKQMVVDEAIALNLIAMHVRNADQVARRLQSEINGYTTGTFWAAFMAHIPGSASSALIYDAQTFQSEASTALTDLTLLGWGLNSPVSDKDYKAAQNSANAVFRLSNDVSPDEYRFLLRTQLGVLHGEATTARAAFNAKWRISYQDVLRPQNL